jgi:two-component system, NarL family, captular synthesis response regulator RcsB
MLDDHEVVLSGITYQLEREQGIAVLGTFSASRYLFDYLAKHAPALVHTRHVLLLDYALGPQDTDGIALIRRLCVQYPASPILIVSGHHQPSIVRLALMAGARGYIGKDCTIAELVDAIRRVADGGKYVHPSLAERNDLVPSAGAEAPAEAGEPASLATLLSPRELEVLRLVLQGIEVRHIAEKLHRSNKTISSQKRSAYRKLGIASDSELFRLERGLFEAAPGSGGESLPH